MLCSLTASAQDVIIKKDGNTIVCKVVEVGNTKLVYKRWNNLQGSNYVMNIADVTSINYENGTKKIFDETVVTNLNNTSSFMTQSSTNVNDAELAKMASRYIADPQKAKRIKTRGWIAGGLLVAAGAFVISIADNATGNSVDYAYIGGLLIGAGIATTTVCLIRAKKYNSAVCSIQSTPIWKNDFNLKNGSTLSASINSIKSDMSQQKKEQQNCTNSH